MKKDLGIDDATLTEEKTFLKNVHKITTDLFNVVTGEKQDFDDENSSFLELLFSFFEQFSSSRK